MSNDSLPFEDDLFWDKVEFTSGCWLWKASTNGVYPTYSKWRLNRYAHRYSWEMANDAQIPAGMEIDHTCRRPLCVRPDHLDCVTHQENLDRAAALITHCPRGHEYNEANTYIRTSGNGVRQCRACDREGHIPSKRVPITAVLVKEVQDLLKTNKSQREIAAKIGISQGYVSRIKRGKVTVDGR